MRFLRQRALLPRYPAATSAGLYVLPDLRLSGEATRERIDDVSQDEFPSFIVKDLETRRRERLCKLTAAAD